MSHRLIVLPDDTANAIIDPINAARHTLNIRMFLFTDPTLLNVVIAAQQRGVDVRVMLNPARRDGTDENSAAREALLAAGVSVRHSSAEFAVTHQKSLVIDNRIGLVRISQLGNPRSDPDPRLCCRDHGRGRSRRDGPVLQCGLGGEAVRTRTR